MNDLVLALLCLFVGFVAGAFTIALLTVSARSDKSRPSPREQ